MFPLVTKENILAEVKNRTTMTVEDLFFHFGCAGENGKKGKKLRVKMLVERLADELRIVYDSEKYTLTYVPVGENQ